MRNSFQREIGGQTLTIETGWLANQAGASVSLRHGDNLVLTTVCMGPPRQGIDFFPLTVEFEERHYAAGKIPGSFFRREGRPSLDATLTCRLTDRPIRPLFPKGFRNEIQVISTVLSADQENPPDILSIIGASAALSISDIPFDGPIAGCRIGQVEGEFVVNPTFPQMDVGTLELVVAGSRNAVVMVEAGAKEVSESLLLEAIKRGQEVNGEVISMIEEMVAAVGKPKRLFEAPPKPSPQLEQQVTELINGRLEDLIFSGQEKGERDTAVDDLFNEVMEELGEETSRGEARQVFDSLISHQFRTGVLKRGVRPDGRGTQDVRPITTEVGILPRTHGSGLFNRGQTQILSVVTLGSIALQQKLDTLSPIVKRRFFHHYNFPPYSVGEVRRVGGSGRRELGHGALAERALEPVIPSVEEFPYTIRLVSEALSSNGSTSMGSICGSSMAMMDAGIPIRTPVAGVAMGLIMSEEGEYAILTDIQGLEDHIGDMDFKVAGTKNGVTALQMDIKVKGISPEIMQSALEQAREARGHIMEKLLEAIPEARTGLSPYAPRIVRIQIPVEKIGAIIGPGGKTIHAIIDETGASIDVEDDGTVYIGSPNEESLQKAQQRINALTKDVEIGTIYTGKVVRITTFGAFVNIAPGKDGLMRLPDVAEEPIQRVEDAVQVGDEVTVMVIEVDRMGRVNVSRRAVLQGLDVATAVRDAASRQPARPAFSPSGPRPQGSPYPGGGGRPGAPQDQGNRPPRRW
jgi:polyribonucleotide nucleotidyltransferase